MSDVKRDFINNVPDKVLYHPEMTILKIRVYSIVRSFMDTTGQAYCSNNWIATKCGVERNAVITSINALVEHGFLKKEVVNGQRYLFVVTKPLGITLDPPGIPENTPQYSGEYPPSILKNTQLDTKDIVSKSIVVVGEQPTQQNLKGKEKLEHEALHDQKNIELFNSKFLDRDVAITQIFRSCQEYNAPKNRWVGAALFNKWLSMENPDNYKKKSFAQGNLAKSTPALSQEDNSLLQDYKCWDKYHRHRHTIEQWFPDRIKRDRAIEIYNQELQFLNEGLVSA